MEKAHHLAILTKPEDPEFPIGIALCDENNQPIAFAAMSLQEANDFGEKFCEAYNKMLQKIRGDT